MLSPVGRDDNVVIIDDFYDDPSLIRGIALGLAMSSGFDVNGNYPGLRTGQHPEVVAPS